LSNKQLNLVMVNLDRILVSTEWEAKFLRCFAWSKTRVGSDHWPILLDTGEKTSCKQKFFYFEKQWLLEGDFIDKFESNWKLVRSIFADQRYSLDVWNGCLSMSKQFLKGWAANKMGESRKSKSEILEELENLDRTYESRGVGAVMYGIKGIYWSISWSKFTRKRRCFGNNEGVKMVVRRGCQHCIFSLLC
jgi:hypothetical protein